MSYSEDNNNLVTTCLNCGTECHDNFCPHCGQSTAVPPKLKMKNFGKGVVMSFGRLTPGFFTTAKGLIIRPWDVIRDHIHGRHIKYSPPITMVIQVFLYGAILYALIDAIFGTQLTILYEYEESNFGYEGSNQLLKLIDNSTVLGTLLWGIIICFATYIGFYRHGAKKYNFAEYLAAFFYMFAAISIYDFIIHIALVIPGLEYDLMYGTFIIAGIFSTILLIKAFPQNKWWKYPILFLWTGLIIIVFINLFTFTLSKLLGFDILAE